MFLALELKHPVISKVPWIGSWFNIGPELMSGAGTTVKQTSRRLGPSMRMVADAGNWNSSLASITIGESIKTVGDLTAFINSRGLAVTARVNDNGDGIVITENSGTNGSVKISVRDSTGAVARSLGLVGEATGTGVDNKVVGSFEKKISITAQDTLDTALTKLAIEHDQAARVVELRFFAGLPEKTIAEVMGINERTVRRHWTFAKAWLAREMNPDGGSRPVSV